MFKSMTSRAALLAALVLVSGYVTVAAYLNYGKPTASGPRFILGVDLAGGSILVYEVDQKYWDNLTEAQRDEFKEADLAAKLKRRVDPDNRLEVAIRPIKAQPPRVEIVLPLKLEKTKGAAAAPTEEEQGVSAIERVKRLITQVGRLEFRILAHESNERDKQAIADVTQALEGFVPDAAGVPPVPPDYTSEYQWVELGDREIELYRLRNMDAAKPVQKLGEELYYLAPKLGTGRFFVLTRLPSNRPDNNEVVTGDDLVRPHADNVQSGGGGFEYGIRFDINTAAQDRFYELTKDVKHKMAIIYDNKVMSAPTLQDRLRSGGQITLGARDAKGRLQVDDLVAVLQAGALPATLNPKPVSELTMGPGLGEDTIRKGTYAVIGAFIAVVVFMVAYYRFAGLVASIALFCNLLLTVGFMVMFNAAFTLPGLAGLVLMLGMAVDANVLIYERVREERERGASIVLALRNGYDRAFPTIIDTHLTSIFTAIVLYAVGTDQLKGFGISLTAGLVISLYTSLLVTRLVFDWALARGILTELKMVKFLSKPNIDFMRVRNYWFAATIILSVLGVAVFIARGEAGLNIDFTGGTAYTIQFKEPVDIETVRSSIIHKLPEPSVDALYRGDAGGGRTADFTIRTTEKHRDKVQGVVRDTFGDKLRLISVDASPVQTDKDAKDDRNRRVDLTINNSIQTGNRAEPENRGVSVPEVEGILEAWYRTHNVAQPKNYFRVKGMQEADRAGMFKQVAVWFKLPDDLASPAGDQELVKAVASNFDKQPVYDRLENFDSQLAQETQSRALGAILLSWLAISLYLWFRFGSWTFGVAAVLCLVHDLMFTVGLIGFAAIIAKNVPWLGNMLLLEEFKLDLPAVAALLTLVGYSVNDTIVVFDRIREVRGKNPELTPQMINDSVNQTLSRTLLTSFITWLVVVVLYIFGGEGVHLFSFVMVVGVIVGTYSSIFVASPLLLIFGEGRTDQPVRQRREVQQTRA